MRTTPILMSVPTASPVGSAGVSSSAGASVSSAAGPAFENCFRSTGTSGSRVLELLVLHVRRKTIGEDGLLKLPYRQKGIPCGQGLWITQDKIREIQLAKGAIRTGIELLMQQYGCKPEEIKNVYLAGGFGFYLNLTSAIRVGLLPEEFKDKISAVGNTALSGAFQAYVSFTAEKSSI